MEISYTEGGVLKVLDFDATLREGHVSTAVVTEHAVETGANIADHIRPELARLTLDCMVSNTPTKTPKAGANGARGDVRTKVLEYRVREDLPIGIPGVGAALAGSGLLDHSAQAYASVLQFDQEFDRVRTVYEILDGLREAGTLVSVTTSLREYTDMAIQSLSAPRTAEQGRSAVTFSIELKRIKFVTTKTVAAPKDPKKTASKKKDLGAKAPVPAENESLAHKAQAWLRRRAGK